MKLIVFFVLFLSFCISCQSLKKEPVTARGLFEKAQGQSGRGDYPEALNNILKIKHQFPYSEYSQEAELLRADIFFDQGHWSQAQKAYQTFTYLYPKHPRAEYADYKQVLSFDRQIPKLADRDISFSDPALKAIEFFIKKYPKSSYLNEITKIKNEIYQKQAEKEFIIAKFYLRRKKYSSARSRLQRVIKKYPKSLRYKESMDLINQIKGKD